MDDITRFHFMGYSVNELAQLIYQDKERKAMTNRENEFTFGDPVVYKHSGEYLGKFEHYHNVRYVVFKNPTGQSRTVPEEGVKRGEKLTPDMAWDKAHTLVLGYALEDSFPTGVPGKKAIRAELYRLLGASGVKVTEEVKERVRRIIEGIENTLGCRFLD